MLSPTPAGNGPLIRLRLIDTLRELEGELSSRLQEWERYWGSSKDSAPPLASFRPELLGSAAVMLAQIGLIADAKRLDREGKALLLARNSLGDAMLSNTFLSNPDRWDVPALEKELGPFVPVSEDMFLVREADTWNATKHLVEHVRRLLDSLKEPEVGRSEAAAGTACEAPAATRTVRKKRSTERGEGRVKLIAALTEHHKYADGSCLNFEPIGNNEIARKVDVDPATASAFFTKEFKGYGNYKKTCSDATTLIAAIKLLNGEFSPHNLYGRKPTAEDDSDE